MVICGLLPQPITRVIVGSASGCWPTAIRRLLPTLRQFDGGTCCTNIRPSGRQGDKDYEASLADPPSSFVLATVTRHAKSGKRARRDCGHRPNEVTILHLRPQFGSSIRMPEEVTSVILGSPETFKAEHNEGEPEYVYVKPVTKEPAQSNLLVANRSGAHVTLELISDGNAASTGQPVDFLLEYRSSRSFLIGTNTASVEKSPERTPPSSTPEGPRTSGLANPSVVELELAQQERVNTPSWTKWNILALSRMNWNTASIIGGTPVTLAFARKVGGIMSEFGQKGDEEPLRSFRYYM